MSWRMHRAAAFLTLALLGLAQRPAVLAAVPPLDVAVVNGRVSGSARDVPLAEMVEEIVGRAGGAVHWLVSRPQRRIAARFAAEPVVEVVRRLLDGGSLTLVLDRRGQVRRVIVLQSPPGVGPELVVDAAAPPEPPVDGTLFTEEPDAPPPTMAVRRHLARLGRSGRDGDIPALLQIIRGSTDDETTTLAVDGLTRIGSPSAIAELATLAQHGGREMLRAQAGKSLESLARRDATAQAMFEAVTEIPAGDTAVGQATSKEY